MRNIFVVILLLVSQYSYSQTPLKRFTHFDESNGLAQAVVSATQDKQGFLWFGTEGNNGVFRYDGIEFVQYKHDPVNPNSLVSGSIYTVLCDSRGDIWFGSLGGGISRYNPVTATFTNYKHQENNANSIGSNLIYSLLEDSKGNIWISNNKSLDRYSLEEGTFTHFYPDSSNPDAITVTVAYHSFESRDGTIWLGSYGGGLIAFDPESEVFTSYINDPNDPASIAHNTTGGIVEDDDGYIWVGGKGGLNRLDRASGKFTRYVHEEGNKNSLLENYVWDVTKGDGDVLWLGGFGSGLAKFDIKTGKVTRLPHDPSLKSSMSSNLIFFLFIDRTGILWAGTVNGGLNKYNFASAQFNHYGHIPGDENSFTAASIFTVYQSSDKNIWLGYQGHNHGLTMWDRQSETVEHFLPGPGSLEKEEIQSIYEDSKNRLYIGQFKVSIFDREDHTTRVIFPHEEDFAKFGGKAVRKMVEDDAENLWVATEYGLVKIAPDRESYEILLKNMSLRTLLIDNEGFLWIGTDAEGIKKYDISTGLFTSFIHDENETSSLSSGEILALFQDSASRIWAGTVGSGLNLLNSDGKTFSHFSTKDGFSSNSIFSIQEDNNGVLWMGSSWGLIRFNPDTGVVRNFTEQDGLQGNEFSIRSDGSISCCNNDLYFVGKKGLTAFDPHIIELNQTPPPVVLTSIKIFNKEYKGDVAAGYTDKLKLSWKENMFSISFAALDFSSPGQNQYMYMMEGFDKDWIQAGNNHVATYTNLDGGDYTFRVKASNNHGVWNEDGISLPVTIVPPWWKTRWAFAIFLIVIITLIWLKLFQVARTKRHLEEQVEVRTRELNRSITDLKETQDQLVESGKMAALGRLVAGVAHEINTPLGIGVTGISHLHETTVNLSEKLEKNELTKPYLEEYIDGALQSSDIVLSNMNRAADLVNSFKRVAVDQTSENLREFEVVDYIKQILNSLSPKLKKAHHEIEVNYSEEIQVYSCPGALSQVISNLIENSLIHGFENIEKGKITIDIVQDANWVKIEYRDNGSGIPSDVIPLIFDPFFTTKRNQGGSGLGMHILYNLITQTLQGRVKCVDTSMHGCLFRIDFPCKIR